MSRGQRYPTGKPDLHLVKSHGRFLPSPSLALPAASPSVGVVRLSPPRFVVQSLPAYQSPALGKEHAMAFYSSIGKFRRLLRFSTSISHLSTFSSAHPQQPLCPVGSPVALQRTIRCSCKFVPKAVFSSQSLDAEQGPTAIDYRSILPEEEFHKLADETIQKLQEKIEEFGDDVQMDGFDVDYGNQVLTIKLGSLGTYVINKQTPNRQIWLSSPISGPSRFDWDNTIQAWIYRRTKSKLLELLEDELKQLCGKAVNLD